MAGCTTNATHLDVQRMIELHAKALQTRERLQRARLYVGMTNGADRTAGIRKLLRMTAGARQMTRSAGAFRDWQIGIAAMTEKARQTRMIRGAVLKFSIVEVRWKLHLLLRRLADVFRSRV
jgi:hypothetical protein